MTLEGENPEEVAGQYLIVFPCGRTSEGGLGSGCGYSGRS
jgi:hypothetical protein